MQKGMINFHFIWTSRILTLTKVDKQYFPALCYKHSYWAQYNVSALVYGNMRMYLKNILQPP